MHWRKYRSQWKSTGKVHAHANAISSLCTFKDYVVSGASDSLVKIWRVVHKDDADDFTIDQVLALQGRYALSLALSVLPKTDVFVLATAGTDTSVQLWLRSGEIFTHSSTLAGHEDWIRSLAFKSPDEEDAPLVLASGSQDATIRLWNIEPWRREMAIQSQQTGSIEDELLDTFETALGDVGDTEEGTRQISLKRHILTIKSEQSIAQQFSVTFDALLVGHEAGVTSLSWRPSSLSNRTSTLLSTSTDSSLILWSPSTFLSHSHNGGTSIWVNRQRFGDIGGQRLGGFVGGSWANGSRDALAWGWAGGWRRWRCANSDEESNESWTELGAISGHSGPVKGLDWSPGGEYIISAGVDQTTRIHGAIPTNAPVSLSWHELSRPQVHGYDLLNVSFVDSLRFVSIADEKVARVFEAPQDFVDLIQTLQIANVVEHTRIRPVTASVPPLGLSNKASAVENNNAGSIAEKPTRRPFEGELALSTLWPEVEKIFGHGYESITLGVSNSRRFIATACKATSPEHAVIRVYDTATYKQIGQPLQGHTLSVTRIAFSPDDKLVLSVSRDRSWRLFGLQESGEYLPIAADKSHGRIIWDCTWASEGDIFATASRDKTACDRVTEMLHNRSDYL
ncbi:WD40-repeat-containing domain protein [Crucibulum laeve]|uniref:Elongator complex protein 2 n=1 Tax=Crucibulum laeve TaxID=68775 RepID=A0A5C3MGR9_9AGAR|nr:WD40-repeat-containing domain protein [Crucibulum laeve]